jgi:RNA polymerase sigma-70 factor (ECF subfamily)
LAITYSENTMTQLVRACVESGAEEAWREFVQRTRRLIGLVVLRASRRWIEPPPALVEDLIQETYLKLCERSCRALRGFQPHNDDSWFSYIKVVALNVTSDYFKLAMAQKRRGESTATLADAVEGSSDQSAGRVAMDRDILLQQIDGLLGSLRSSSHPKDREIFWLYYRSGLSARAIAELPSIGGTVKFVERRLARLTSDIREAMLAHTNQSATPSKTAPDSVLESGARERGSNESAPH